MVSNGFHSLQKQKIEGNRGEREIYIYIYIFVGTETQINFEGQAVERSKQRDKNGKIHK